LSILAWFSFIPLLLAIEKKSPRQSFRLGFVAGLVAYAGIFYWVNIVMTTYGKLPWPVSFCLFILLAAYLALYAGAVAYLVRKGATKGISPLISFPFLWTGLEFVRAFAMTGFPWASLGHSQYRTLPLIQIADITGLYGVSFLIALANVVFYRMLRGVVGKDSASYPTRSAIVLLLLMALTLGYGFSRLNSRETGELQRVVLVQGNIPQDVKWDPEFQETTVGIYEKLSRKACSTGGSLVIWPGSVALSGLGSDSQL